MTDHPAVTFLLAAHKRAEQLARAATPGPWSVDAEEERIVAEAGVVARLRDWVRRVTQAQVLADGGLIAGHASPDTVLRRVAAEREILAEHEGTWSTGEPEYGYHRDAPEAPSRTWTVTTTVTAPTPEDAERWAGGIAQMVQAEFGDSMRLEVVVAPVATPGNGSLPTPATTDMPIASRPFEGAEIGITQDGQFAWRCDGGQGCEGWVGLGLPTEEAAWSEFQRHVSDEHAPASPAGAATGEEQPC